MDGQPVRVLGRLRRHGVVELLVVLADGSKRMIPQAWTDAQPGDGCDEAATLGGLGDLLGACVLVSALSRRGRLHGSRRARRTTMQPVELSLLPEPGPVPVPRALDHLPGAETAEAVRLLAALIAKAVDAGQEADDE
jgi:hypothetical protein